MLREEWLRHAVEKLDANLFGGDLDILNKDYQITVGSTRWDLPAEVFLPYDGEDVTMDDFFPITIVINHQIKEPDKLLEAIALGCIQGFFGHQKLNKKFKTDAMRYYFEFDKRTPIATDYLKSILLGVYGAMVKSYGEFPGKPIYKHKTNKRETSKQKNTLKMFCPSCNYEAKVSRKIYEKYGQKVPTCICGTKMAIDLSDEDDESKN